MDEQRGQGYWKANRKLILILLSIWALVSLGFGILLIRPLNAFRFFELPLGFWFAQQGSIYVFVLLIFVYAWRMDRIDRDHDRGKLDHPRASLLGSAFLSRHDRERQSQDAGVASGQLVATCGIAPRARLRSRKVALHPKSPQAKSDTQSPKTL